MFIHADKVNFHRIMKLSLHLAMLRPVAALMLEACLLGLVYHCCTLIRRERPQEREQVVADDQVGALMSLSTYFNVHKNRCAHTYRTLETD